LVRQSESVSISGQPGAVNLQTTAFGFNGDDGYPQTDSMLHTVSNKGIFFLPKLAAGDYDINIEFEMNVNIQATDKLYGPTDLQVSVGKHVVAVTVLEQCPPPPPPSVALPPPPPNPPPTFAGLTVDATQLDEGAIQSLLASEGMVFKASTGLANALTTSFISGDTNPAALASLPTIMQVLLAGDLLKGATDPGLIETLTSYICERDGANPACSASSRITILPAPAAGMVNATTTAATPEVGEELETDASTDTPSAEVTTVEPAPEPSVGDLASAESVSADASRKNEDMVHGHKSKAETQASKTDAKTKSNGEASKKESRWASQSAQHSASRTHAAPSMLAGAALVAGLVAVIAGVLGAAIASKSKAKLDETRPLMHVKTQRQHEPNVIRM
jgi:hypothetical protein